VLGGTRSRTLGWEEVARRRRASAAVAGHIDGLDGLRALAVLAVVGFHVWPRRVSGGFLGVDVFFVISGFLITTLLVREGRETGRVDLLAFWRRRARRLLPALIVVIPVSVVVAAEVNDDLLVGIDRQTIGALTFSSNWLEIGAGANYFDATTPKLFGTFWSLGVEEQFYLLWPVVLVGLVIGARNAQNCVRLAGGLAVVSAGLMAICYRSGANPTRVYYGTDTHLFGLMIGAAVAFAFAGDVGVVAQRRWSRLRLWVGWLAMVLLVAMMVTVDGGSAFAYRGGIALASLLTAVMVASLPGRSSAFTSLHRWRPLAWVGERSYGIYLWHWPVILLVAELRPPVAPGSDAPVSTAMLALAVTFGLAEVSYRWIEMPIRRQGFEPVWEVFRDRGLVTAGVGTLIFPGIVVDAEPNRQWRDAPEVVARAIDDGTARPVVILNFGTNTGLESAESRTALEAVLGTLGPDRRVVLVNTVGVSDWVPSTNATLAALSAEHPNTIVADWHAVVHRRPDAAPQRQDPPQHAGDRRLRRPARPDVGRTGTAMREMTADRPVVSWA
jgi:peptidoglycan/LPS O-acetylase OafA/YrhL